MRRTRETVFTVKLLTILLPVLALVTAGFGLSTLSVVHDRPQSAVAALAPGSQLVIQSFSFNPSTISSGSQTTGTIQLSGGTPPYYAWLNGTPSGCSPNSVPYQTSNHTTTFNCSPTSTGNFNVHLDVVDSSAPASRASQSAPLTVNSNGGGGGGGGGKNSSGGFSLPGGLLSLVTILAFVFLGATVALAAGVIASGAILSKRLRQLNETLKRDRQPTDESKRPP